MAYFKIVWKSCLSIFLKMKNEKRRGTTYFDFRVMNWTFCFFWDHCAHFKIYFELFCCCFVSCPLWLCEFCLIAYKFQNGNASWTLKKINTKHNSQENLARAGEEFLDKRTLFSISKTHFSPAVEQTNWRELLTREAQNWHLWPVKVTKQNVPNIGENVYLKKS